jgi:hypothetical protein
MGLHYSDIPWHRDLEAVAGYYEERLATLVLLAEQLRGRVMFVEAEALLDQTATVLHSLTHALELNEPLQRDYRRFAQTGERGFGDPSGVISTGRVNSVAREQRTPVIFPPGLVAHLEWAYEACAASLRDSCQALAA